MFKPKKPLVPRNTSRRLNAARHGLRLEKLAFAALSFGYTELAIHALRARRGSEDGDRRAYQAFLDAFLERAAALRTMSQRSATACIFSLAHS